ncbi:DNA polymerase lambda-like [Portunus trituberculatus]|uniref:DNA polymerase lambda-like n=1 Tax=Portunus trituberculatus TaxID=210409 RepID=UPI001E1D0A67|nr:DNA polymerase lambda-like [Portunus trituberculatus]
MKRKNKGALPPAKQHKAEGKTHEPPPQFLAGLKCHIHPANFGLMRHKVFENHITRYGGELVLSLPDCSEAVFHIVFEETVDEEKVKRLVDTARLPNCVFLKCTWLIESIKAKTKAGIESHLIMPITSVEDQCRGTDESWLQGICQTQVEDAEKAHIKNTDAAKSELQRNENPNVQDCSAKITAHSALHEQKENVESQTSAEETKEDKSVEDEREPEECSGNEVQQNRSVLHKWGARVGEEDHMESLIRPFPKNLQDKFACARPSSSKPVDLNAHITSELGKLAATYKSKNDTWRAVGYERAVTAIRNYGKEITSREEALAIPGIGGRLADKIAEILESGRLRKVAEVCEGEEAETLRLFLGVWGAGPSTAQAWYLQDYRTLDDLRTKATLTRHQQIGLKHYDDINSRIPRSEVAEIEDYVREATLSLVRGAEVMVCGSYRRGKLTCGDVDVLITHPDGHSHELIFRPLLAQLRDSGFVTDDLVTQEDNGKSMRLLATKKGMSLSEHSLRAGIVRQTGEKLSDGYMLDTPTEESIFTHLGLEYHPPEERDH